MGCPDFGGVSGTGPELVAVHVVDLMEAPDSYRVLIRHSKTDQEGQGQEIAIPKAAGCGPVQAVQTWLAAAEIICGPGVPPCAEGRPSAARAVQGILRRRR